MPEIKEQQSPVDDTEGDISSAPQSGAGPGEASDEAAAPDGEELRLLLEDARAKADEHWDLVLRTNAEMDNLRKRQQRELDAARKFALENFVSELLGVRDSLELGVQAATDPAADVNSLREGSELTLKLLNDVMSKFGVQQIDPEGEPFDPELHQAISMVPRDDVPPNTVVTVVQRGYTLNGRLVRPAMVMVSQGGAQA
jgi:molecular chaperone GrpE